MRAALFEQEHISSDHREATTTLTLNKPTEQFKKVSLRFRLACPAGHCDHWDRIGYLGGHDEAGNFVELLRFATPYGVGTPKWEFDVTPYRSIFTNSSQFKLFIDTWVKPGHPNGNGWLASAHLIFSNPLAIGSTPQPQRSTYSAIDLTSMPYGVKGQKNISVTLPVPPNTAKSAVVFRVTGHGQGSKKNAAEFMPNWHTVNILSNEQLIASNRKKIWRDNCAKTATPNKQKGTWTLSRAGWCPGADVKPWVIHFDSTALQFVTIQWLVPKFTNQLARGQTYNGHQITKPYYLISASIVHTSNQSSSTVTTAVDDADFSYQLFLLATSTLSLFLPTLLHLLNQRLSTQTNNTPAHAQQTKTSNSKHLTNIACLFFVALGHVCLSQKTNEEDPFALSTNDNTWTDLALLSLLFCHIAKTTISLFTHLLSTSKNKEEEHQLFDQTWSPRHWSEAKRQRRAADYLARHESGAEEMAANAKARRGKKTTAPKVVNMEDTRTCRKSLSR